jgi:hypothetical protein
MKMAGKNSKTKNQKKSPENRSQRSAQIFFAVFAIILILSMVLAAVSKY